MMKKLITVIVFVCSMMYIHQSMAVETAQAPIGLWRTYDLDGIARSIVQFSIVNGHLEGRIVKKLNPAKGQQLEDLCRNCPEPWHNQKKIGMTVVWGLKQKNNEWLDGRVLDTDTGNVYRCRITMSQDSNTLHLHAYVGVPMLGRTVDWVRIK